MTKIRYDMPCNLAQTLNLIGDKWTMLILFNILHGLMTYKELQDKLTNIPTNLLARRLKELVSDEFLSLEMYQSNPPRYNYLPTEKTKELKSIFYAFAIWGEKNLNNESCFWNIVNKNGHKIEFSLIDTVTNEKINTDDLVSTRLNKEYLE
ncbi:winged helix-turn-helix transcriptional regulator [Caviibacter abscessus]|uniref:winged helix-turn-helix transcriptional regulator n=1 Tax=Caviibacter abscessus TaxID=1766719 RepID=UPI00082AA153|nr:helix-turn-helix domain-containing protein [Caviibacter abscessus]